MLTRSQICTSGLALCAILAGAYAACGGLPADADPDPDPSTVGCFVAYGGQFTDFRTWPSHHMDSADDVGGQTHVSGPRTEYINTLSEAGADEAGLDDAAVGPASSTEFPQGTIIVKEIESADPTTHHVFAMVKRGCDFNPSGAKGWEWFELSAGSIGEGKENILWRGTTPPDDKGFADCNGCHANTCAGNDSVCSTAFTLVPAASDAGATDGGLRD